MSIVKHILDRFSSMEGNRGTWNAHWQEIADYMFPNHSSFEGQDSPGIKRMTKVFDSTPIHANEMLAAGLHGRMTNPATQWFELKYKDKRLNNDREASIWLSEAQRIQYEEMQNAKTAFTSHMNELYLEYCAFGNGVLYISENSDKDGVLYKSIPLSTAHITENEDGIVDTLYRLISMSVSKIVLKFGIDNVSDKVSKKYAAGKFDDLEDVIHAVEPRIISKHKSKNQLKFISIYVEKSQKHLLRDGGFEEFPYAVPRYYKASGEVYARGPGTTALPDSKMLNQMMKTTLVAAEKAVDPPMQVPNDTFIKPIRTVPGGINFFDPTSKHRAEPLYNGANAMIGMEFMQEIRERIRIIFFNDQMQLGRRPEMTATEVIQRTEDMMRMMGPILGRMQAEALNTIINRTFNILLKQRKFPDLPAILRQEGADIEIAYTSAIAKAQRQLESSGLARLLESLNLFISQDPSILQRFDTDEMLEAMVDLHGIRPSFLKPIKEHQQNIKDQNEALSTQQSVDTMKTGSEAGLNLARAGEISGGI